MHRVVSVLATGLMSAALPGLLAPVPAHAEVIAPLELIYEQNVYGDILAAGNSVLKCPDATDTHPAPEPIADCLLAADRQGNPLGNTNAKYYMRFADVDGDPGTFNSSTAQLTVPAGATVAKAHLFWAGGRGQYQDVIDPAVSTTPTYSAAACGHRGLDAPPDGAPSTLPAGTPDAQTVQFSVNGAVTSIAPGQFEYTGEADANIDPDATHVASYYSADADVTAAFASAPTGVPLTLTTANIWTPEGYNCFGGWTVLVVYDFGQGTTNMDASLRRVYLYDGHVRQFYTDPPTTTTVTGFEMAKGGHADLAAIGYEGDWGIHGDSLLVNGQPVADPTLPGSEENFFLSNTDGATSPKALNNMSVDGQAFPLDSGLVPSGTTSADVAVDTSGDNFMFQGLAMVIPMPDLTITKIPRQPTVTAGQPITYDVVVDNVSAVEVDAVLTSDLVAPDCSRDLGTIPAGEARTYTCTLTAPSGKSQVVNTINYTGISGAVPVSGQTSATVNIVAPVGNPPPPAAPGAPQVTPPPADEPTPAGPGVPPKASGPSLPVTGPALLPMAVTVVMLLLAGVGAVWFARKRKPGVIEP